MICPVCGVEFLDNSAEGCNCGYSINLLERIGSLMEYNGQRMTTQSSLILAVVIGMFSIITLTSGIGIYISIIILLMLSGLGFYLIERLEDVRMYNMALEDIIRFPTKFIEQWKNIREQENRDVNFMEYLEICKGNKRIQKSQTKRNTDEGNYNYLKRLIFATKYTKYFYFIFMGLVFGLFFVKAFLT